MSHSIEVPGLVNILERIEERLLNIEERLLNIEDALEIGGIKGEPMDIEEAIRTAQLWREGQMIGGDEDSVRNALLDEVFRLRDLFKSRDALEP